jgi:O-methyltransferase
MLEALRSRFRRLKGGAPAADRAAELAEAPPTAQKPTIVPASASTVVGTLDAFLEKELSYDKRDELFAALVSRFAAHNPVESQVKAMFDAVLTKIVAPMHGSVFWGDRMLTLDKAAGFFDDATFRHHYEVVRGSHIYDAYDSPHTIAWRLHTLIWAARTALAQQGDFVECGVFKGDMSWMVASVLGKAIENRTFYLYDSFEGLSPKLSDPGDYPDNPGFLDMANKIYSAPAVFETVMTRFANMPHVKVVRGFVPDSFKIAMPERIAYLHIDLNSPQAEIAVLEQLFDRVVTGGAIIFDDYGWKHYHLQREAEDRFMAARGHSILELPTGQGLVIKH